MVEDAARMGEMKSRYKISMEEPEGKRILGKYSRRWEYMSIYKEPEKNVYTLQRTI
jgi:hypothetical protein